MPMSELPPDDSPPDLAHTLEEHLLAGFPPDLALDLVLNELVARAAAATAAGGAALALPRGEWAVETKSVKLYLETFREQGIFHEHLATVIRDDFVAALTPVSLSVAVNFNSRGGIALRAVSSHPSP